MKISTIIRGAMLLLAGLMLAGGIHLLHEARQSTARFEKQSQKQPINAPVDLSQAAVITLPFTQTWSACHGQELSLVLPADVFKQKSPAEVCESLEFAWHI